MNATLKTILENEYCDVKHLLVSDLKKAAKVFKRSKYITEKCGGYCGSRKGIYILKNKNSRAVYVGYTGSYTNRIAAHMQKIDTYSQTIHSISIIDERNLLKIRAFFKDKIYDIEYFFIDELNPTDNKIRCPELIWEQ
mgnify:CR=1 FL=1